MSTPLLPARVLPAAPNLEQQRKQARELLDGARANDPDAVRRILTSHPRFSGRSTEELRSDSLALHDAQLVIAREYGFPSWPKLKAQIEETVAARRTRIFVRELGYYDDRARGLLEVLPDGAANVIEQVRSWHPAYATASDQAIRTASLTIDDARLIYAREHGFEQWAELIAHLEQLGDEPDAEPFLALFEAGKSNDWPRVTAVLREHPDLARARGTNGNTLLNLASSLSPCADTDAPPDTPHPGVHRLAAVQLLLAAGADPNQANDRGWTPLHQAAYRNDPGMAEVLLDAGAGVTAMAHGEGGTPLAVALFWGNREAAEVIARAGVVPNNLRMAAGLGLEDLVRQCFTADGTLTSEARRGRAFYRPHSGFPAWRPSDDPQEVLDEALVWATKSDRVSVMPLLVERGARVNADPYRGTPLIWAAATGRLDAARWLLDNGANINLRATFGGQSHGSAVTALHLAAQRDQAAMVDLLLARGADPTIEDALYHSTALGWARHDGARRAQEVLEKVIV